MYREGSGKSVHMRRLAWAFAERLCLENLSSSRYSEPGRARSLIAFQNAGNYFYDVYPLMDICHWLI